MRINDWLALLGLERLRARWQAALAEGTIALDDRATLARLEGVDYKRHLLQALLWTLAVGGLLVVALLLLSLALLAQFWDSPQRLTVAWGLAALWLLAWGGALVALLAALRRLGQGFALTRHELQQDWQNLKEPL